MLTVAGTHIVLAVLLVHLRTTIRAGAARCE